MSGNDVLAVSLHAMQGDMARLQQVSMNMANALTPGYKRGVAVQSPVTGSFGAAMNAAAIQAESPTAEAAAIQFPADQRPGTLKRTGQSWDVALAGKGYFEVMTESGPAYTRHGSFQLDARGRLVTAHGHAVMGRDGEIFPATARPVVSEIGVVTDPAAPAASGPVGQLKVVQFEAGAQLDRLGDGLLRSRGAMSVLPDGEIQVRQGFLENSNVNSAHEMTQLLQAMRHFETMTKVAQAHDEMLGTAIRKLGETG